MLANVLIGLKIDLELDMDCHAGGGDCAARRFSGAAMRWLAVVALASLPLSAAAVGTSAGGRVDNAAQLTFALGGVPQATVTSNTVSVIVDEVLDAVVVDLDAAPVAAASGATAVPLSFSVTNTGNGTEAMHLAVDAAVTGDGFDPGAAAIYLESNSVPGLQTGAGGDTAYLAGTNDPVLAHDGGVTVYVAANIPTGLPAGLLGRVSLRAVPRTAYAESGTDDPTSSAFPAPGASFAGAGDPAAGGGNATAVVGSTFAASALRLRAFAAYQIDGGIATLTKTVVAVTDPRGGSALIPGAVVRYQISVAVAAGDTARRVVVRDPVPAALAYVPGSLTAAALPPAEQPDDDFIPSGSDNTGFDGPNSSLVVTLGDVVGGALVVISFDTTIR